MVNRLREYSSTVLDYLKGDIHITWVKNSQKLLVEEDGERKQL